MRVAFYAPLKPPDHPIPSGDRAMARSLMGLLAELGREVEVASRLRSYDRMGDARRQARMEHLGVVLAERYLRAVAAGRRPRPDAWFTYHLYHKAPDHLGPRVATALKIPYLVAEASLAAKQAAGPWAPGYRASLVALERADLVLAMTKRDARGLTGLARLGDRIRLLRPFIAVEPFARLDRRACRGAWAKRLGQPADLPWLLTVAMMRGDVKSRSYALLRQALAACLDRPWLLVVAGDGPARAAVEADLATLGPGRVALAGFVPATELPQLYAAADLLVWPALAEAYGLVLLEAQAAGLPAIAGRQGGVPEILEDGVTGLLVEAEEPASMASAIRELLGDGGRRRALGRAAKAHIRRRHSTGGARRDLEAALATAVATHRRRRAPQPAGA